MTPQKSDVDTLSARIKAACKRRGWSLRKLAEKADLNHSLVISWANGRITAPQTDNITRAAAALKVSFSWLVLGVGDPDNAADIPEMPDRGAMRTYGQLPGWDSAEREARRLAPELDWAFEGIRRLPVDNDEQPKLLTGHWVVYRAQRFDAETEGQDELRDGLCHDVRERNRRNEPSAHPNPTSGSRIHAPSSKKRPG